MVVSLISPILSCGFKSRSNSFFWNQKQWLLAIKGNEQFAREHNGVMNLAPGTYTNLRDEWIAATPHLDECILNLVSNCDQGLYWNCCQLQALWSGSATRSVGLYVSIEPTARSVWWFCYGQRVCFTFICPFTIQDVVCERICVYGWERVEIGTNYLKGSEHKEVLFEKHLHNHNILN